MSKNVDAVDRRAPVEGDGAPALQQKRTRLDLTIAPGHVDRAAASGAPGTCDRPGSSVARATSSMNDH